MPTSVPVPRRPLFPGSEVAVSAITLEVDPGPNDPDRLVRQLRLARAAGVTTFDTVGAAQPGLAETLLARAFPRPDPELVVLARPPEGNDRSRTTSPFAPTGRPRSRLEPVGTNRLDPGFLRLYETAPVGRPAAGGSATPPGASPDDRRTGPAVVHCATDRDVDLALGGPPPWLLSGTFNLLESELPMAAARRAGGGAFGWVARDVLAGGRLDGSRFALSPFGVGPAAPLPVREVERELARIAPLGFLAWAGRRTLAQAALHFVLDLPWVATACVPVPDPRRWEELAGFSRAPALEPAEREVLARRSSAREGTP